MVELMKFLESHWQEPDEGIWEVRGGRQHFTHSKMMAWLAFDRAIKLVEECDCAAASTLIAGAKFGMKFTQKFAIAATTRRRRLSHSFMGPMPWMRAS